MLYAEGSSAHEAHPPVIFVQPGPVDEPVPGRGVFSGQNRCAAMSGICRHFYANKLWKYRGLFTQRT